MAAGHHLENMENRDISGITGPNWVP